MLSRNKVAVPEGAAGTPPFWSHPSKQGVIRVEKYCKDHLLLRLLNFKNYKPNPDGYRERAGWNAKASCFTRIDNL